MEYLCPNTGGRGVWRSINTKTQKLSVMTQNCDAKGMSTRHCLVSNAHENINSIKHNLGRKFLGFLVLRVIKGIEICGMVYCMPVFLKNTDFQFCIEKDCKFLKNENFVLSHHCK